MTEGIEVLREVERVAYTVIERRDVRVHLVDRPDIVADDNRIRLGKKGDRWSPSVLDIRFERVNGGDWTTDVQLTVALRLKSGGVSGRVNRDHIGFEIDGDFRKRPYGDRGWPHIELPKWVPGIIESHAPDGWPGPACVIPADDAEPR